MGREFAEVARRDGAMKALERIHVAAPLGVCIVCQVPVSRNENLCDEHLDAIGERVDV